MRQAFILNVDWWNSNIANLQGRPIVSLNGPTGRGLISREHLFGLAADAADETTGAGALRLLWHTLLWGTGKTNRNNLKRIAVIETDPQRFGRLLRDAARMARTDAREAFSLLKPRGLAIKHLRRFRDFARNRWPLRGSWAEVV